MKVVIIGGVALGATLGARLRRLSENIKIEIYEETSYISYANCGLPYYLGNVIKNKNRLLLETVKSFKDKFNIDAYTNSRVISINRNIKTIEVLNLLTNETYTTNYDYLVIGTGASAIRPNIPGSEYLHCLKNVDDLFNLVDYIKSNDVKDAVVIGGGFIGLEVVENLCHLGIKTTLIDLANQVLTRVDYEMSSFIQNELLANNVDLKLGKSVEGIEKENGLFKVKLNDCDIETKLVISAIGVRPNSKLAIDSGLDLGINNSIKVNEYLMTSDPYIYAGGDVIETINLISNKPNLINLAGPANKQARIIANNIMGIKDTYKGNVGASIIKVFDLNVGFVGLNEKDLNKLNMKYYKIYLSPNNHASYYPNSNPLMTKILYDDNQILGAQVIGKEGVDKKIDVLSLAIYAKLSIYELGDIDFSYAPPFNSAKDLLNVASFIASNLKLGLFKEVYYDEVFNKDVILLDVRTKSEYDYSHIEGFINIDLNSLRNNLEQLAKNKTIYVLCESAYRSYLACRILSQNGYDCYNIAGGYRLLKNMVREK